jgi:formylglycine-generating enzyme required for sulfatase activity
VAQAAHARAELFPPPDVPARLVGLGFRGVNVTGAQAILPPLIPVAAGPFLMGSDKARDREASDDETPQQRIELAAFQIGKYPVTVAEYALAVRAGAVREPPAAGNVAWQTQLRHPDHPAVNVSWQDATAYVAWLREVTGRPEWRLPSEAQWEKASRWDAGRKVSRIYPWGDNFDKNRCNTSESGVKTTTPIGSYPASDARRSGASPWGAEDMAGNVWEWTSSLYKPYPYTVTDGREDQDSTENRTLRGGSWYNGARFARAAYRNDVFRWVNFVNYLGFRLALSPVLTGS